MPSRIRFATLRITLESSTTRQVFMMSLTLPLADWPAFLAASCGQFQRFKIEQPVDIENHEQFVLEPVDAGCDTFQPVIEINRHGLCGVDDEPVGLAFGIDADGHRRSLLALAETKPMAHVDRGDDTAAQIDDPGD